MLNILARINELSRTAKERALTAAEKTEQIELRQQYLRIFRGSVGSLLLNSTIIDPNGMDVTPEKLRQEQARRAAH
ncbi:DUF896 domain-containing protein [Paenibacillus albus]|uniref:UPF0291 protein EJC50_10090 n=1 Tax=Paenibacillus albus TaxID=2495582 RepID=A0A3S9A2P7_9BACL|nr:DUF896 domain-containing protein [Paenibacillus albus]AZN39962.1 DUF896 domain-containing protein [Paenibacillus albus]